MGTHAPPFGKGGKGGFSDADKIQIPLSPPFPKGDFRCGNHASIQLIQILSHCPQEVAMFAQIKHAAIYTQNPQSAIAFYEKILGM